MSIITLKLFEKMTDEQKREAIERQMHCHLSHFAWTLAAQAFGVGHLAVGTSNEQVLALGELDSKLRDAFFSLYRQIRDNVDYVKIAAKMWVDEYIEDAVAERKKTATKKRKKKAA